jgi:hypothetical protein
MTEELVTSCGYCPWSILAWSADDKARKEQTHRDRLHADVAPDTDEMCARMVGEHREARAMVLQSIRATAHANGGQVDPNVVRHLLPRDLNPPQIVGAVYRLMKMPQGLDGQRLVEDGEVISTDSHGRNTGKKVPRYRLVDIEERRTG